MHGEYLDMPELTDRPRFEGLSPMMVGHSNPFPGAAAFDFFHYPIGAQLQSFNSPSPWPPSQWAGLDSQAGTPNSWGSSSIMATPMVAAPMPAVAVMPPTFPVSSEGWPRPLAAPDAVTPPWKDREVDEGSDRRLRTPRSNNTSLSRSISLSSSPSTASLSGHRPSLSRKTSLSGNAAEAQKRPPRDWRTDFSLNGNGFLSGLLAIRGRSKSFGGPRIGGTKVVLHPYIRYNASTPSMRLDLRDSPNALTFHVLKDRALTIWDLMRFVCEPPLQVMRFYHSHLPWYIDVEAQQNPVGVTLYDLFLAIYLCMMTQIQHADYFNVEMNGETRAQVNEAWADRCRTEEERSQGIRRVDYLMGRVIMEGIQKGKDGLWEIKTRKIDVS